MNRINLPAIVTALVATCIAVQSAPAQSPEPPKRFPVAKVRFEQNATDGDVEVVFDVTGRSEGLVTLTVEAPDGRKLVDFKSDSSIKKASGIREFLFESPEPKDVAGLKTAFPEGVYKFKGQTAAGAELHGEATLSHKLPGTTTFIFPKAEARDVMVEKTMLRWAAVQGAAGYVIELEQEDSNEIITAKLPATATTFAVPEGFLRPGKEYALGIGAVNKGGNVSFVETSFTTSAPK